MRVAIGSLVQETNTFVPFRTTIATFEAIYLRRGEEMLHAYGHARTEIPAFIDVLRAAGADIAPLLGTHAAASGPIERASFEVLVGEMVERLRDAGPVDAVLLSLHGALVVEDEPDGDAEIVARVRAILPAGTPIGVSLDLHGHITPAMLQPDVFYIGYREYPHIDLYETGERVAHLLLDVLAGRRRPVMAMAKRPLLVSPVRARTDTAPLDRIVAEARRMEAEGRILHASVFPVQPWMDIPDLGFATLACADGDTAAAQRAADRLADLAWAARDDFDPELTPLDEAIRIGLAAEGLTVVGDVGDAPSGGTAADHTGVLEALLAAGAERAGPPISRSAMRRRVKPRRQGPVRPSKIAGRCAAHAGAQGTEMAFGLTAVLAIGNVGRARPALHYRAPGELLHAGHAPALTSSTATKAEARLSRGGGRGCVRHNSASPRAAARRRR